MTTFNEQIKQETNETNNQKEGENIIDLNTTEHANNTQIKTDEEDDDEIELDVNSTYIWIS